VFLTGFDAAEVMKIPSLLPTMTNTRLTSSRRAWHAVSPLHRRRRWSPLLIAGLLWGISPAGASKPEERPLLIPLAPLGYQVLPMKFMSTMATVNTLHFVDDTHLLFTFTVRTLLPRLPDAQEGDDDRNVAVELLELPTGKVLAKTEWRTRDHDRYLWPLGNGRFLLRQRSRLSVIDPLRNLQNGQPFEQQVFLDLKRPIGHVAVSPEGDLLGVETLPPPKPKMKQVDADAQALAVAMGADSKLKVRTVEPADGPPVKIYFFRLHTENADGGGRLIAQMSGLIGAPNLIALPATAEGFLDLKRESAAMWDFDFVSHSGKRVELSGYETSCPPHPYWISRSEFIALGCHGSADRVELSYFNMKGDEPWLAVLNGVQVSPVIISAPEAGRFALSRTLVDANIFDNETLLPDDLTAQEITVFQGHDGRQLLKVQAQPIQRAGQNFDLSPSGLQFAVLRGENIEVYKLPPLTEKDKKALELARSMAPEPYDGPIRLGAVPVKVEEREAAANPQAGTQASDVPAPHPVAAPAALPSGEAVPESAAAPPPAAQAEGTSGDQQGPRKPPSLYSSDYPKDANPPLTSPNNN